MKLDRRQLIAGVGAWGLAASAGARMPRPVPKQTLAVEIVPSGFEASGRPLLILDRANPIISVRLHNISGSPVKVWQEICSWGFSNLRLEISSLSLVNGRLDLPSVSLPISIERAAGGWGGNGPITTVIPAGAAIARPMRLRTAVDDIRGFAGFPDLADGPLGMLIRAIYAADRDDPTVWYGQIESPETEFTALYGP